MTSFFCVNRGGSGKKTNSFRRNVRQEKFISRELAEGKSFLFGIGPSTPSRDAEPRVAALPWIMRLRP
jgi:hypothetical protein